ncbi:MAG: hypothetical protein RBQ77_03015 [Candidatus Methanomethylophilaceae archaeon]|jgi:DNA-directed RNA polymerase subunit L|nr:hypothetical protein [Candidatus Methanomethylophilaceae archaeon]NLF33635.1 hypothetical protein [Thermoplasmatales archaeon]
MQPYIADRTDDSVTVRFRDADVTLLFSLMRELRRDANVELVRFIESHPELEDRALYLKVREGDPMETLSKASVSVSEYFSGI